MNRSIIVLFFAAGFSFTAYADPPLKELRTFVKPIPGTLQSDATTDPETGIVTANRAAFALIQAFEPARLVKLASAKQVASTKKKNYVVMLQEGDQLFEAIDASNRTVHCRYDVSPFCLFDAEKDGEFETIFFLKQTPMALSLLLADSFEGEPLSDPVPYTTAEAKEVVSDGEDQEQSAFDYKDYFGPSMAVLFEWAELGGKPGFELVWVQKQRSGLRKYSKRVVLDRADAFPKIVSIGSATLEVLSLTKGSVSYRIISGFPDDEPIELSRKSLPY